MIEEPNFFTQMKLNIEFKESNKNEENYKMVIVVREDLDMGKGKIAAQVGHGGNF